MKGPARCPNPAGRDMTCGTTLLAALVPDTRYLQIVLFYRCYLFLFLGELWSCSIMDQAITNT